MLWEPMKGAAPRILDGHFDAVRLVTFSHDGNLLASSSDDETVRLWDSATGTALQTLQIDAIIDRISFSEYENYLETDRGLLELQAPAGVSPS